MLMTENPYNTYAPLANNVGRGIAEITDGKDYYVTPQLHREFENLGRGVDHIKLDYQILDTSPSYKNKFSKDIGRDKSDALQRTQAVAQDLASLKTTLNQDAVNQMQENEIRELHHSSQKQLLDANQKIMPYALAAKERIDTFSDNLGVTDRFTGYRNNLSRGSRDAFRLGLTANWKDHDKYYGYNTELSPHLNSKPFNKGASFGWSQGSFARRDTRTTGQSMPNLVEDRGASLRAFETDKRPASYSYQTDGLRRGCSDKRGCPVNTTHLTYCPRKLSPQEFAGIPQKFPGKTEYFERYKKPKDKEIANPYSINPLGNFNLHGRPLGKYTYTRSNSEYQHRYLWPDGNTLESTPWLRK